jgi:hypothetical protein
MPKISNTILILACAGLLQAAELKVLEFRELPSDYTAQSIPVFDMDNNFCAALRVEYTKSVPLTVLEKTYKTRQTEKGENYFFFSTREKALTLKSPGYQDLVVNAPSGGFKPTKVYYLYIQPVGDIVFDVTINTTPAGAKVMVDGKAWTGPTRKMTPGEHSIEISKEGFVTAQETIKVPMQPTTFNFALSKIIEVEKTVTPPPPAPQPVAEKFPLKPAGLPSLEAYDLSLKIISCKATPDNKIIIRMQITNLADDDRELSIDGSTRMFDEKGREYSLESRTIGNKEARHYQTLNHKMISGVPNELILTFINIPSSVQTISLLELEISDWKLPFRSFPVSR